MMRRYAASSTRFSQPDPYDGSYKFTNPQSFNRYNYVNGDPVNMTDPSGLESEATGGYCSPMYSSCAGTGGGGYGGTPFDSGSIIFGGYNEVPPSIRAALADWNQRLQNEHEAQQANYYLHHGRPDLAKKLTDANKTLVTIVVLSPAQIKALALIGLIFLQAIEDRVRLE